MNRSIPAFAILVLAWSAAAARAGGPPAPPSVGFHPAAFPLVRLRLSEGFAVTSAAAALADRLAVGSPLSLTTCDFDADGMPDAVAGWSTPDGGLVTVHRGNVDLLWPNTPDALERRTEGQPVDAAFLAGPGVLELGLRPDLLGCGQLDGDGYPDLVAARLGGQRLELLLGDGHGGVARRVTRELPGPVTALAVGEVNRRNGLDDLVVGLGADDTARLLILEGPDGAVTASPESIAAAGTVRAIVLAHLDDDPLLDLAAAAGSEVMLVRGRDRKLALDDARRLAVPSAKAERMAAGVAVESLTAIDLEGRGWPVLAGVTADGAILLLDPRDPRAAPTRVQGLDATALQGSALVAARSFGHHGDDLLVVDRCGRRLLAVQADSLAAVKRGEVVNVSPLELPAEPVAVLPMRLDRDGLADLVVLTAGLPALAAVLVSPLNTYVVDTPGYAAEPCSSWYDSDANLGDGVCESVGGGCTLMAAADEAWWSPGADSIVFEAQPYSGDFWDCDSVSAEADRGALTLDGTPYPGLWLRHVLLKAPGCVVRGVEILDFAVSDQADGTLVEGNTIHEGSFTTSNNTLGGTVPAARNILGGITFDGGLSSVVGNVIQGNWVGTEDGVSSAGGGVTLGPYEPVLDTVIGGTMTTMRNLISGGGGVVLDDFSQGTVVQGNYIGTDVSGTAALGNTTGVEVQAPNNTVGGTSLSARNVIGSGQTGVRVYDSSGTPEVLVQGNLIGTDLTGTVPLGFSSAGVELNLASDVVIGGLAAGAGNLISGCSQSSVQGAIWVRGPSASAIAIQGNRLGTDLGGTAALANYRGIRVDDADYLTIGGTRAGSACSAPCNLIAASTMEALYVTGGSTGMVVRGNFIGTDVTGTTAMAGQTRIRLDGALSTRIGGTDGVAPEGPCRGACNLISGATSGGVSLANGCADTVIAGNFIGTDVTGSSPLGNGGIGVSISSSPDNTVGGDTLAARNVIAASGQMGVRLTGATTAGNVIRRNLIGLGVDGETLMGSGFYGVLLTASAADNTVGGLDPEEGNAIAGSGYTGIRAESTAGHGNAFLSNAVWDNTYLGVDIGVAGVDTNDPGDGDDGANGLQNYPVLTGVLFPPTGVTLMGHLDSTPSTTYWIQLFANRVCGPYGYGEGQTLLGTDTVTTGSDGHTELTISLPDVSVYGQQFTATATDPDGNTSELSACLSGPPGVDVGLIKSATATAAPGDLIQFELQVENLGDTLADSVTVSDSLNQCLTELVCTSTQGACQLAGWTATATLGGLAPLAEATVTITARVGGTCPVDLTNTATAAALGDVNPGNDSDSSHTRVEELFSDGFESGNTSQWSNALP